MHYGRAEFATFGGGGVDRRRRGGIQSRARPSPPAPRACCVASRAAVAALEAAIQTHGGYAFDRDYDVVTLWPMVRLMEIAPINNEMLLNYIGEHVLGLPKSY